MNKTTLVVFLAVLEVCFSRKLKNRRSAVLKLNNSVSKERKQTRSLTMKLHATLYHKLSEWTGSSENSFATD